MRNLSYPSHLVVNMPSLSPTMESGSISKWNVKEGDRFEPGTSLCDVETDKATVSFDATEEGYIAKILISSGDIKVGQPLLVTVEEEKDVAAFAQFKLDGAAASALVSAPSAPAVAAPAAPVVAPSTPKPTCSAAVTTSASAGRVFASPLAKKLVKDAGDDLQRIASVVAAPSGPNGRIVAADVREALKQPRTAAATGTSAAAPAATTAAAPAKSAAVSAPTIAGEIEEFVVTEAHHALAARLQHAKRNVPHYYLSVELNLSELLRLRNQMNQSLSPKKDAKEDSNSGIAVLDLLIKASAQAMRAVPEVNAAWMDSFVRQYHQVDINVVSTSVDGVTSAPVLRDVHSLGLSQIAAQVSKFSDAKTDAEEIGTFTVHDLGMYGVRSAAPILIAPQAAAVAFGSIQDVVVPATGSEDKSWAVAPVMVCTMVCDHRVVDGAVSAQWLSALKNIVENPVQLMM
jgi:pyruvate dehydrogenase E2 component (dihydrolipoamide acetyltransferase)